MKELGLGVEVGGWGWVIIQWEPETPKGIGWGCVDEGVWDCGDGVCCSEIRENLLGFLDNFIDIVDAAHSRIDEITVIESVIAISGSFSSHGIIVTEILK